MAQFFNFRTHIADNWWDRRSFLRRWWRVNSRDPRWTPPPYPAMYNALVRRNDASVARFDASLITMEAITRGGHAGGLSGTTLPLAPDDQCVGMVVPLLDARAGEAVTWLALMAVANDDEATERLVGAALEAHPSACVMGPTSLAPHMAGGVLLDSFNVDPPLNSPYNPPYVAELLEGVCDVLDTARLWHVEPRALEADRPRSSPVIEPFAPARLAADLHPLLCDSWEAQQGEPPDAEEVACALDLWWPASLSGWLAQIDGAAVGYALVQPDLARCVRRLRGGRPLWARSWMALRAAGGADAGCVPLAGVAMPWRRQGIGRALLAHVARHAQREGWRSLWIGPLIEGGAGELFLRQVGAQPRQRYARYTSGVD